MCPTSSWHVGKPHVGGTGLVRLNVQANKFKEERLQEGCRTGFVHISDGWRSGNKKSYHNHILLSALGPVYLRLVDKTGESGTGEGVADEIVKVQEALSADTRAAITMGITDTPSANRKAWRLLEALIPGQLWMGCMCHEVSLFFKECLGKVQYMRQLAVQGLQVVKWFNNHSEILKLFREGVQSEVQHGSSLTTRQLAIGFYMPGDTRMASAFRMLFRITVLRKVLVAVGNSAEYQASSQKALKAWSDAQSDPSKKHQEVDTCSRRLPRQCQGSHHRY